MQGSSNDAGCVCARRGGGCASCKRRDADFEMYKGGWKNSTRREIPESHRRAHTETSPLRITLASLFTSRPICSIDLDLSSPPSPPSPLWCRGASARARAAALAAASSLDAYRPRRIPSFPIIPPVETGSSRSKRISASPRWTEAQRPSRGLPRAARCGPPARRLAVSPRRVPRERWRREPRPRRMGCRNPRLHRPPLPS